MQRLAIALSAVLSASGAQAAANLGVTASTTGVVATYRLGPFNLQPDAIVSAPRLATRLDAPGLLASTTPGYPAMPAKGYFFALPPHATARLVVEEVSFHEVFGVWIAPPETTRVDDGAYGEAAFAAIPDSDVYSTDGLLPAEPVQVVSRGVARDVDYALVEVAPFQWNPVTGVLRIHDLIKFRIDYGSLDEGNGLAAPPAGDAKASVSAQRSRDGAAGDRVRRGSGEAVPAATGATDPLFVNGPVPTAWRVSRAADGLARILANANPAANVEAYKILVDADGIYRLGFADFAATGLAPTPIADLRLELRGQQVAFTVFDAANDRLFNTGDSLEFYGVKNPERWTTTHVYWLSRLGLGMQMTTVAAFPPGIASAPSISSTRRTARAESNDEFFSVSPLDPDDWEPWTYAQELQTGDGGCRGATSPTMDLPVTALNVVAPVAGKRYEVRGILIGRPLAGCIPENRSIEVSLAGSPLTTVAWSWTLSTMPDMLHPFSSTFDAALVREGTNTIHLNQPKQTGKLLWTYVDHVEVDYEASLVASAGALEWSGDYPQGAIFYLRGFTSSAAEVIDTRSDGKVERIAGLKTLSAGPGMPVTLSFAVAPAPGVTHRLAVCARSALKTAPIQRDTPSDLSNRDRRGEYVAIAHRNFLTETSLITDWRAAEGLTTQLIDLQDVYDEFSYGNVHNDAIRDFLAVAYSNWTEKPLFVLLVGDSTDDPKQYRGFAVDMLLPHGDYMRQGLGNRFDLILPSDAHYVRLVGGPEDYVPDMLIGRLAVRAASEVSNYMTKLQSYETSAPAAWNGRFLLIADDDIYGDDSSCELAVNDGEQHIADMICCYLGGVPAADVVSVMEDEYGWPAGEIKLVDEHNAGLAMAVYMGHGAVTKLGKKCNTGLKDFFGDAHLSRLTETVALPLFASVSCNVGRAEWIETGTGAARCMGETFTTTTTTGDIAYIAQSTSNTISEGKAQLRGMLDALFQPGSTFLPPFAVPGGRERVGAIHFASQLGFLLNPSIGDARRFDNAVTLTLLGDPAVRLKIPTVPPADRSLCRVEADCPP